MDLNKLFEELQRNRFFGSVEVKLENGNVVIVRKTETIKPTDRRDNRGESDGFKTK
jgi:hypothetical protein